MKKSKVELIKMIHETKWVKFEVFRNHGRGIKDDEVGVNFGATSKDAPIIDRVSVNIGPDVVKKLGWSKGDKIIVMHHPDNLLHFNLCKSDNGKGITLSKGESMNCYRVQFKWPYVNHPLKRETLAPLDYNIVSHQLLVFIVK